MPELPATVAGVVITIGITALLAAATGATVKIAGNELGAKGTGTRALTGLVGILVVAWSAWSMREQPFEVSEIVGGRLDLLKTDDHNCVSELEVAVLVRFHEAPGIVRYEVRLGPGVPIKTFKQKFEHTGSGSDLLGPQHIRLPVEQRSERLRPSVVIVSPNYVGTSKIGLGGPKYFAKPRQECRPARSRGASTPDLPSPG